MKSEADRLVEWLDERWRLLMELALVAFAIFLLVELRLARQNERELSKELDRQHMAGKGKL